MLSLVGLHLNDEVNKVLWFREELQLLSINKVPKLIFNLDHELDDIQTVQSVFGEGRLQGHGCFLSSSEIVLDNREHVFFDFIVGFKRKSVLLIGKLLPESDLIGWLILLWDQVSG